MSNLNLYDSVFYKGQADGSLASARRVMDALFAFIGKPASILDVGCGIGTWGLAAAERGVGDYVGMDGNWVDRNSLVIPQSNFHFADFERPLTLLGRRFDLAISLEVAEHLTAAAGERLVSYLTEHADLVLFSAAIPGQGGVGHINEQWPSYWAKKFSTHRFMPFDLLRPAICGDQLIKSWYRQNSVLYARIGTPAFLRLSDLKQSESVFDFVLPDVYEVFVRKIERRRNSGVRGIIRKLRGR